MPTLNGKPVYFVSLDDKSLSGFNGIAMTKTPATKGTFIALKEQVKQIQIHLDDDQQILYGPLLIPDQPIERWTKEQGTFYIVFTKDVIKKLAQSLFGKEIALNYEHIPNQKVDASVQELWITGSVDKSQQWGFDYPEGTLFGGVKIHDRNFWLNQVKTKNVIGFSIEAVADLIDIKMKEIKLAEIQTKDGLLIKTDAEAFTKGVEVYTEVEGEKKPLSDGEYDLGNGMRMIIVEGKVADILEITKEEEEFETAMKAILKPYIEKIEKLEAKLSAVEVELSNLPGKKDDQEDKTPKKKTNYEIVQSYLALKAKSSLK